MTIRTAETSRSFKQRERPKMKAIVHHNYGSADNVLELQGIDKPTAKDKEVLV
jgi:hypothetical protein